MISDTNSARQPTEHLSGAEVIVKALQDQGVDVVFGYPGGAVLPLYDELFKTNKLRHILVRHEQAAVHAAEGYARSTGKIGVDIERKDRKFQEHKLSRRFFTQSENYEIRKVLGSGSFGNCFYFQFTN